MPWSISLSNWFQRNLLFFNWEKRNILRKLRIETELHRPMYSIFIDCNFVLLIDYAGAGLEVYASVAL